MKGQRKARDERTRGTELLDPDTAARIEAADALFERAGYDWPKKAAAMAATVAREIERQLELSPQQIERVRESVASHLADNIEIEIKSFVRDAFTLSAAKLFLDSLLGGVKAAKPGRNWGKLQRDFQKEFREFALFLAKRRAPVQRGRPHARSPAEEFFLRVHLLVKLRSLQEEKKSHGQPSAQTECLAEIAKDWGMSESSLEKFLHRRNRRSKT